MKVYSNAFFAMNTRFVFVLPNINESKGEELYEQIKIIADKWERRLSRFDSKADLFRLNNTAHGYRVTVPIYLAELINLCEDYWKKTEGLFDPTYASVYDLLKKNENQNIELIRSQCGWDQLEWNKVTNTIRFNSEYMQLDFGSFGKGVALKQVVQYLKSEGIESAFLSFGESSIATIGSHPFGKGWPILISESSLDSKLSLCDDCISISGMQENGENLQAHIYHPVKREMVSRREIVAVQCDCPITAEIISTTIYMADLAERNRLIEKFQRVKILLKNQQ